MRLTEKEFERLFGKSVVGKKKSSKYLAVKTEYDGKVFDSGGESGRYAQLKLLQRGGYISDLELQPKFDLIVNDILICRYVADFRYIENGKKIVEDFKGVITPAFRMKEKLMLAIHGITILKSGVRKTKRRRRK